MRILLVENNPRYAKTLITTFQTRGFVVEHTDTAEDALELARHYEFDLTMLSLALPDMDGSTLIARIRRAGRTTPVIALANLPSPILRMKAFSAGADDVVEQDIDQAELLARMGAVTRRARGHSHAVIQVGALTLNVEQKEVLANGNSVELTAKEYALLQFLMLRKNTVLSKETILSQLYGGMDEPEAKIIDVFVCKIRRKLANAGMPTVIGTVWGRGYTIRDERRVDDIATGPSVPQPIITQRPRPAFA